MNIFRLKNDSSTNHKFNERALLLIPLILACFALSPIAQAANETTSNANTAEGFGALQSVTTGSNNTALGAGALFSLTTGVQNTATGAQALHVNTASNNTADGFQALVKTTIGNDNTAVGWRALFQNTTGVFNTAVGSQALYKNTSGGGNTAIGDGAGLNITTGGNNIDIDNEGQAGDTQTIRIGNIQARTFIAGISGVTTGLTAVPVVVDANGQLGTISSSRRFKNEIKPMDKTSEAILALKPVTFHYKSDTKGIPQFGLIAEEVAAVNPDLVVRDKNDEIYTVRYDAVNAMLLNEFLKEHRKVQEQAAAISELKSTVGSLAATVKEQAAQIQKVSAQLEVNKPVPQTVANN